MPKTISKALEHRLARSESFKKNLEDLHHMTGLEALYLNSLGEEQLRFPREPVTSLRLLDHQVPFLNKSRTRARQGQLIDTPSPHPYPWIEVIHPIRIEEETVGYLVLSAWRPISTPLDFVRELWLSWARQGKDVRWKHLEEAWYRLPEATEENRAAWKRHLRLVADESIRLLEQPNKPHLHPDHLPPMIRNACVYVQDHYHESLTLSKTAKTCGVSPEHLSRTFHQSTGLRFQEYVTETRIQMVCQELQETSDPIGQIAERNGFNTLSRFNQAFRETTGLTPREWRKRRFRK